MTDTEKQAMGDNGSGAVREQSGSRRGEGPRIVADALRSAIISGELSPNERLVEADLVGRYGVGRAAVRSALLKLEKEGLIEREQSRGARVRSITVDEAIEIAEARLVNEALCAARAAQRATDEEIEELGRILAEMRRAHSGGDLLGYSELNHTLHLRIREFSRHATAAAIVEQLRNQSVRQNFRIALLPGRTEVSLREHEEIVAAITERDSSAAEAAMRTHLGSVIDALQQLQESSEEATPGRR